jgi:hypothetical protein
MSEDNTKLSEQKASLSGVGVPTSEPQSDAPDTIPRLTTEIIPKNWNETHTYYFAVTEANNDGTVNSNFKPLPAGLVNHRNIDVNDGFGKREIPTDSGLSSFFTKTVLPLTLAPQALSISMQFASSVQATNRGILEENNGVVFRSISIAGTTGVWKNRPVEGALKSESFTKQIATGLFPGATDALTKLTKNASSIFGTDSQTAKSADLDAEQLKETGYYQFWSLHNFFLEYAHNKKKAGAGGLRLLFCNPKDNITYVVTPIAFDLRRDAGNPLQYKYSIQLRAWDISTANANLDISLDGIPDGNKPLSVKSVAERIRRVRNTINSASNVIKAVQNDVFDALNLINQSVLAVKDVVGLGVELADVYPTLINNVELMVRTNRQQWSALFAQKNFETANLITFNAGSTIGGLIGAKNTTSKTSSTNGNQSSDVTSVISSVNAGSETSNSNPINSFPTGESPSSDSPDASGSGLIAKFLNNPATIENVPLQVLGQLPTSMQIEIKKQVENAKEVTANDIAHIADKLKQISENLAYSSGLMDEDYARVYGLPAPIATTRIPTEDDIILIAQIEDGRDAFISTLATGTIYNEQKQNPFVTANLANSYQMPTPSSGVPIFVPRGASLDDLAKLYLGDANRAREIAILNELRAPYIDEAGFILDIRLATDRTFVVNNRTNLFLNQKIKITGNGLPATRRTILAIEDIGSGDFKVTVDGKPNLNIYTSLTSPGMTGRPPGTVGSGDVILIPSGQSNRSVNGRQTSLNERLSHAEKVFKVDMALSDTGDLAIGTDGDILKSYGYKNAVQAIQIALETEKGELEQHLAYGLDAQVGEKLTGDLITGINQSCKDAVTSDPRFQTANVTARLDGSALNIRVDAIGSNGTGLIPVEFKVTT